MIKGGYRGKVLRVNLTDGNITTDPLPDERILRKYVGNFGLGLWYLMKELPDGIGPQDPENPLIFMNGPLVGSKVPCPNNCTITTLNGDTGFTAGRSHTHGWFGPFLSMAGYDGIIISGASGKWVYLWIDDETCELRDAEALLGRDTHETEDLIKADLGLNKRPGARDGASVAAIGPAGENLIAGAAIMNDKNHGFCHSGVGQIMGSKHLKAIAVRGTGKAQAFDDAKLREIVKEWTNLATTVGFGKIVKKAGSPIGYGEGLLQMLLGLSAKNWTENTLPGFGDGMSRQKITPKPCFRCPIGCCYDVEVIEGPYKGYVASLSGGGENMEGSAAILGVGTQDPGVVFYLTDLNDRLGIETSTIGCAMAVAFEAFERGLLTAKDTDGLELKWGDAKVAETLLRRIVNRDGQFAQMLADGPKVAAEKVGLPDAAVHIKGSGMNLHDWRRAWGVLLGQIVGGGSGWAAPGADCWSAEPDAGYPWMTDPLNPNGKGEEVAKTGIVKLWNDCYGCCWYAAWGVPGIMKLSSGAIAAVVGWEDFTPEEALAVGHRVLTLERIFNMKHGLTAEDDINISARLTDPAPADAGPAAGKSIGPHLEEMVRDYYQEMGWDRKTGRPLKATMEKLRLQEFMDVL